MSLQHQDLPPPEGDPRPTVLVVEDVVLVRMLLADFLRTRKFDVIEAASGEEAARVLKTDCPVDIVVSDIYMPGAAMDGIALARWVQQHRQGVKVLLGSGVTFDLDDADADLKVGPLLVKPYNLDHLEERLRDLLRQP
jgi:CheY-like chemotaxis protein